MSRFKARIELTFVQSYFKMIDFFKIARNLLNFTLCLLGLLLILLVWWKWHAWQANGQWPKRLIELQVTRQNAQPIIRAIRAHIREKGRPPGSLADLMPRYIKTIPATGTAASGAAWRYSVSKKWQKFVPPPREHHYPPKSDWALGIVVRTKFCPFHWIMSFGDYFMYHPQQDYQSGYGGGPEPLWDWAFYHE